ncbi:hypothetical protein MUBE_12205 [Mycobacterium uberis]|uniref:Beta-xylosidase n=1 Tax=Mycobacterium uberis TaxID=2162698 RepID=A0A3E1HEQ9_9MYCO|nr:hypothetical protein [Mycobacterium uberis]RFD24785.1 hypothetical protein MUBE_12205 [Mycobacterium uberis]
MKIFDRFNTAILVSAGLCGAALAFSPGAEAAPLPMPTGGPTCIEQMSGLGAAPAAVPAVLPGPVVGPVPPVPLAPGGFPPVVPPVAPVMGPLLAEDPVALGSGTLAGKGVPTAPPQAALSDFVVLPGPSASIETLPAAVPVGESGPAAAESLLCCVEAVPLVR